MNSMSKISKNSTYLQIIWNDGEESKFNYMWLRDNCPTAHDKDSRHRMFNILEVSKDINPKKYSLNDDGKLEIEWSEGEHTSYYDPKWLRENCYTIKNKKKYKSPYQLWDNNLKNNFESICIDHDEVIDSDEGLIKWLELLHHKGIAIVKRVDSCPPCILPDEVKTPAGFSVSALLSHSFVVLSRKYLSSAAILPNRHGLPKIKPSQSKRSCFSI